MNNPNTPISAKEILYQMAALHARGEAKFTHIWDSIGVAEEDLAADLAVVIPNLAAVISFLEDLRQCQARRDAAYAECGKILQGEGRETSELQHETAKACKLWADFQYEQCVTRAREKFACRTKFPELG